MKRRVDPRFRGDDGIYTGITVNYAEMTVNGAGMTVSNAGVNGDGFVA